MRDCGDMRDMRDMRDCGDMRDMRGYEGYAGRTTSPKSGRGVCRFFGPPPPIHEGREKGTANASQPKRNAYFPFKLLIINDINQYFNIHLHLISFIIYNR